MILDAANITKMIKTNTTRELSLYFPPPLFYSLHAAISFSIILSEQKTHEWFYSNFIQMSFLNEHEKYPEEHPLHIYPVWQIRSGQKGSSLLIDEVIINDNIFMLREEELIENIIRWINNGYYIISSVDVSKLPGTRYYNQKPSFHGVMCYGYDLTKKVLKHIDFDKNDNIMAIEVNFSDYINSFYSSEPRKKEYNSICLCKLKENVNFKIDISNIKNLIYDYINSVNTSKKYNFFLQEHPNSVWGLNVYPALNDFIKVSAETYNSIDYRPFHALYEHKTIMTDRLKYLESIGVLNLNLELSKKFIPIEKHANNLRLMLLKYNHKNDISIILRMERLLAEIYSCERVVLNEAYKELNKYIK